MATEAAGPVFVGGFETITVGEGGDRYSILFLPDKHNDDLQAQGKAPVYYWMPGQVRMARRGDVGDYKFHLIHFVGVRSDETSVGVEGTQEVAGGVFSVTTTAAFPLDIMQKAQEQLLERFRGKDARYWGWRTPAAPMFRGMPIVANSTAIASLSPQADGSVAQGGESPAPGGAAPGGAPAPGGDRLTRYLSARMMESLPRTVPHGRAFRAPSNLNAWFWELQGQGPGSINPTGENAYTGLVGSLPAAILWQGFHGAYSPICVTQAMKLKVWSQTLRIKIRGNWDRVFEHFSAATGGRYYWFSGDIKAEFNNLRINGGIEVELEIDGTIPGADKLKGEVDKRVDLIIQKFMEQAEKRIFEPGPPDVKPAESNTSGWFPYSAGFSLKYRRDSTKLNLSYDEVRSEQYLQDHVISSALEGFYEEIKRDPANEKKYFTTLYLDDWERKVTRIVKPVVNWPDESKKWVGEPVSFLSVQVGYPSARGDIQWNAHIFQGSDTGETTRWQPSFTKKDESDVSNAPEGWTPDQAFIKRRVHFLEPPGESDSPFMRVSVEKNVVDLDPEPNGTLSSDNTIEVRADSAGKLEVGPISLNIELENTRQMVEVELQANGNTAAGNPRPITRFLFKFDDQAEPRFWEIFTGQLDFIPSYKYRVHAIVKGGLMTAGIEWWGPWEDRAGNGPLMISVPTPDGEGVTRRSLLAEEISAGAQAPAPPPAIAAPSATAPAPGGTTAPAPPGGAVRVTSSTAPAPPATGKSGGRKVRGYTFEAPPAEKAGTTRAAAPPHVAEKRSKDRTAATPRDEELVLETGWHE